MDTADAARRWAREWSEAWEAHDSDRVGALYAPGAIHLSAPFREPRDPREYAEWAFSDEDSAECRFSEPFAVAGDRAVIEWWAVSTSAAKEETLAGVSLIRFDDAGIVLEQRDYWHLEPGRREL